MKNPKQKGNSYENKICKELSKWASKGEREDIFCRTSTSGGQATMANRRFVKNKTLLGDICAVDAVGNLLMKNVVIECKHRRTLHWDSFVYRKKNESVFSFWEKVKAEAKSLSKIPVMILRQNNVIDVIAFPVYFKKTLNEYKSIACFYKCDCVIYEFNEFLKNTDYNQFCSKISNNIDI